MKFKLGDKVRAVGMDCQCQYCKAEILIIDKISKGMYGCSIKGDYLEYYYEKELELVERESEEKYEVTWI